MEKMITYRELTLEQRRKTYENYLRIWGEDCDAYGNFAEYDEDQTLNNFEFDAETLEFPG
jgi:hypothetical protein